MVQNFGVHIELAHLAIHMIQRFLIQCYHLWNPHIINFNASVTPSYSATWYNNCYRVRFIYCAKEGAEWKQGEINGLNSLFYQILMTDGSES